MEFVYSLFFASRLDVDVENGPWHFLNDLYIVQFTYLQQILLLSMLWN